MNQKRLKLHSIHKHLYGTFSPEYVLSHLYKCMADLKVSAESETSTGNKLDLGNCPDYEWTYAPFLLSLFHSTLPESMNHSDVDKDMAKSVAMLEQCVLRRGFSPPLMNYLATLYDEESASGVRDMKKAVYFYKRAADEKYAKAMYNMGELCLTCVKDILDRDVIKAENYFNGILKENPFELKDTSLETEHHARMRLWEIYSSGEKMDMLLANSHLVMAATSGCSEAADILENVKKQFEKEVTDNSEVYEEYSSRCRYANGLAAKSKEINVAIDMEWLLEQSVFSKTANRYLKTCQWFKRGFHMLKDSDFTEKESLVYLVTAALIDRRAYSKAWFEVVSDFDATCHQKFQQLIVKEVRANDIYAIFMKYDRAADAVYNSNEKGDKNNSDIKSTCLEAIAKINKCFQRCYLPRYLKKIMTTYFLYIAESHIKAHRGFSYIYHTLNYNPAMNIDMVLDKIDRENLIANGQDMLIILDVIMEMTKPCDPNYNRALYFKAEVFYHANREWKPELQKAQNAEKIAVTFLNVSPNLKNAAISKLKHCSNCDAPEPLDKDLWWCPCNLVQYCDEACQKFHWANHSEVCPTKEAEATRKYNNENHERNSITSIPKDCAKSERKKAQKSVKCRCCRQPINIPEPCRCNAVVYCSPKCKRRHWGKHQDVCEHEYICSYCMKKADQGVKLGYCPCESHAYCNRTCQLAHWETHKLACTYNKDHKENNSSHEQTAEEQIHSEDLGFWCLD